MTADPGAEPPTADRTDHSGTGHSAIDQTDQLRERAVKQLKKRRDLLTHVVVYVLVNSFLVMLWLMSGDNRGFFWPIFPIAGWGIAVLLNAWDVWRGDDFSPAAIDQEMRRLQGLR
ncbi:MAG TPA: 2TM domain-containing protein [Jatrophihabitans sp.]|nr:2TM domain-containing protein [Jatrophihabitans sp.]